MPTVKLLVMRIRWLLCAADIEIWHRMPSRGEASAQCRVSQHGESKGYLMCCGSTEEHRGIAPQSREAC